MTQWQHSTFHLARYCPVHLVQGMVLQGELSCSVVSTGVKLLVALRNSSTLSDVDGMGTYQACCGHQRCDLPGQ